MRMKIYNFITQKEDGLSSSIWMSMLFCFSLILIIFMYVFANKTLVTHQHEMDDALSDAVLASLVADDEYYFISSEQTGTPVIKFRDTDDSFNIYVECMNYAKSAKNVFYKNFAFEEFIEYEVEGDDVTIISYSGNSGNKFIQHGAVGVVKTPSGTVVTETSAFAKVSFDVQNILTKSPVKKTRTMYCTLKVNQH